MFFGRGKNTIQNPYTVKEIYNFYIEDTRKSNPRYNIECSLYCEIVYEFYKSMMEHILKENGSFNMPWGFGSLCVHKTKVKLHRLGILSVDWVNTVENNKHIHHLNEHSKGYKYFFHWSKKNSKVKNLFYYKLVMTRANKRLLAKLIKTGKYDFFEI
jgi:hypothetical protein